MSKYLIVLHLPTSSNPWLLFKPDATPAALMQSWSLLTQLNQTDHPLHPHTGYCAVWGVTQLQPVIFT
eukprot:816177-Pelagomonas_calceolata.AAC.1